MKILGKIKFSPDQLMGSLLFLCSLVYLSETRELFLGNLASPGPGLIPLILGFFLLGISILLLAFSIHGEGDWGKLRGRSFLLAAGLMITPVAFNFLGYLLVSFGLLAFSSRVMGVSRLLPCLLFSGTVAFASYVLFKFWLQLPLPEGILPF